MRPFMVLAVCELFGGRVEDVLPAAVSIEMIHSMSLVQDDLPCMDDDDMRRGRLACHKKYGEDMTVLACDALIFQAFEHIAVATPATVGRDKLVRVIAEIARCSGHAGLVGGQVRNPRSEAIRARVQSRVHRRPASLWHQVRLKLPLCVWRPQAIDLDSEGMDPKDVTLDTLKYIAINKSGMLFAASLVSSAILSGASESDIEALRRYAHKLGYAYQVDHLINLIYPSAKPCPGRAVH